MKMHSKVYRSIWIKEEDPKVIQIIDQRFLPFEFIIEDLKTCEDMIAAIKEMHVRGAPLIGVAAAYGVYLALLEAPRDFSVFESYLEEVITRLNQTRPTAVNLLWALEKQKQALQDGESLEEKVRIAFKTAQQIEKNEIHVCEQIGTHGVSLIEELSRQKNGQPVNVLTHCNAGWLACVEWGTQTAPIYKAFRKQIPVHVWVSETRPRNQGARLTAWELGEEGIPYTIITDNAAGHLLQRGMIDLVLVGSDRTSRCADAANKVGTYLKALAAYDNGVPFYVALPSSSIDWTIRDGIREIPIEQRDAEEVTHMEGVYNGKIQKVLIAPSDSSVSNYSFDVTPARLITGLITERGICDANEESLLNLFPENS